VKSENIRTVPSGEAVAVFSLGVIGRKIHAEGKLIATTGKKFAEIELLVSENAGKEKSKKNKTPRILLSGRNIDPLGLSPNGLVVLGDRDPLVYQRYQDVAEGIYWINTESPLASAILKDVRFGDRSIRWRDYLFQRYVDIFTKQAIHELQRRDPENFRADMIDGKLDEVLRKVHSSAVLELRGFFFDEGFEPETPNVIAPINP
jgi:hypothetical protein